MLRMCREIGFDLRPDPEDPDLLLATCDLDRRVKPAATF